MDPDDAPPIRRSGFVAVIGRTNVGKSSLVNALAGERATIVSRHPNTTRRSVRVISRVGDAELVLVDTPGIAAAHDELSARLRRWVDDEWDGADRALLVVDAERGVGARERELASRLKPSDVAVVARIDRVRRARTLAVLAELAQVPLAEYFVASVRTGEGIEELRSYLASSLPEGPALYEAGVALDLPRATYVAEVVREEFLHHLRDELPQALACQVESWSDDGVEVVVYVERPSQRAIVLGHEGRVLAAVRRQAQRRLRAYPPLTLRVKVQRDWRRSARMLDELGL
ncbi:GTP-binding protein Era [Acidimicrobium ferrooxidans DSM 10331]|uniref:GTPase Era n=1 Tax=Acidimicrobium ferrooxidans (strain DSM 10331 / JCM 15462 / NBRC 103882 / ICP) TaxID=525909 RepID=ERA_ACIFD|nr:GTPase Era [Acidimicrobium ferrooxidans]C7LZP1.1 RecName: Full=GTPase Era [Acidimicrobium ferrooxidans DSM 10331]ACU54199.1 GTP-binding protein Era [Acidimicrobium ferrooxidans DSM 10331]